MMLEDRISFGAQKIQHYTHLMQNQMSLTHLQTIRYSNARNLYGMDMWIITFKSI